MKPWIQTPVPLKQKKKPEMEKNRKQVVIW
jgi:hypothetical protein